ncbi:MAG TPA: VWA domain-containing protein [Thermoanaerobaculia bacterium]|nr:VWA domain-containing protein [Thermoanaerobaculia bacterium]
MTRFLLVLLFLALPASAQTVRIMEKPAGLVDGILYVPIEAEPRVERLALFINNVKYSEAAGNRATIQVKVGQYIRRLRMRAVGYDGDGNVLGEDEMVVNDPRPPFRIRLQVPPELPESGEATLEATVITPPELRVERVDFYVGEEKVDTVKSPPYRVTVDSAALAESAYARVVARASDGSEANDVAFFGERIGEQIDVTMQQVPLSIATGPAELRAEDLTLIDNGTPREIEALVPASDQPLHVILLIDYSESMLEELPVVKAAAKQFAQRLLRPQDRIAVVGFHQRTFWLTGFTNDYEAAAEAVDSVKPIGQTHLYDSVIEMLFELQKARGRRALVVLSDGVDQGSRFNLDHLMHYARYAGVPIYPVVKNRMLTRLMRFGIGQLQARRLTRLARETGATYFIIRSEGELPEVYGRIAAELRQQYQLVFHSEGVADQWHSIAVESRRGHVLRVPRGYFP